MNGARRALLACGLLALAGAWLGPLPQWAPQYFSAHMGMHVIVVAIAAPLLAGALGSARCDPVRRWPGLFHPLPTSVIELVVIWTWHAPALHHLSRHHGWALAIEQASFLTVSLMLWLSAFGGDTALRLPRAAAGVAGLLMTSMHMTLLGVLLALAPRSLYGHGSAAMDDQQWGGILMLAGGGISYLAGGLVLLSRMLDGVAPAPGGRRGTNPAEHP